jgi:hypothetical protein
VNALGRYRSFLLATFDLKANNSIIHFTDQSLKIQSVMNNEQNEQCHTGEWELPKKCHVLFEWPQSIFSKNLEKTKIS